LENNFVYDMVEGDGTDINDKKTLQGSHYLKNDA